MAAIWGALEGLGSGLQEYGTTMYKSQLADKLEKQREARAEERQIAKEKRDAEKITGQKIVRDPDGTTWRVGVNSAGLEKGERVLASAQEIKAYNREEASNERKDSKDALDLWLAEQKAADYGEDKDLDRLYKRSQIDQMGDSSARGWAAINLNRDEHNARLNGLGSYGRGSSGGNSAATGSMFDYVDDLAKSDKGLIEAYGDVIPEGELDGILQSAVTQAAKYKMDTRSALREILYEKYGTPGTSLESSIQNYKKKQ